MNTSIICRPPDISKMMRISRPVSRTEAAETEIVTPKGHRHNKLGNPMTINSIIALLRSHRPVDRNEAAKIVKRCSWLKNPTTPRGHRRRAEELRVACERLGISERQDLTSKQVAKTLSWLDQAFKVPAGETNNTSTFGKYNRDIGTQLSRAPLL